eukprot:TRINITY_DN91056_c0_g1_i1.p1 TRINITY_DN91056_c0_g1~~TRINITY_DN91056_c0_g1_i1.p1  ORF type:complete len:294 (+),score=54.84 TRINITY_DN91056_c0_g1_i1:59-940(+)
MTSNMRADFERDGFVIVRDILSTKDLEPIKEDLNTLTRAVAAERSLDCEHLSFEKAVAVMEAADPGFGAALHKAMTLTPAVSRLWQHPELLQAVHALTGWQSIAAHPIFNIRPKSPSARELNYGLHQDPAFWGEDAASIGVIACWLPLVSVSSLNGTLMMIQASHKAQKLYQHFLSPDGALAPFIPDTHLPSGERVLAELSPGDAVFFAQHTVHGGCGPNRSDLVRWAMDLRWQSHGDPNFLTGEMDTVKLWDVQGGSADVDVACWAAGWAQQERRRKADRAWEKSWPRAVVD